MSVASGRSRRSTALSKPEKEVMVLEANTTTVVVTTFCADNFPNSMRGKEKSFRSLSTKLMDAMERMTQTTQTQLVRRLQSLTNDVNTCADVLPLYKSGSIDFPATAVTDKLMCVRKIAHRASQQLAPELRLALARGEYLCFFDDSAQRHSYLETLVNSVVNTSPHPDREELHEMWVNDTLAHPLVSMFAESDMTIDEIGKDMRSLCNTLATGFEKAEQTPLIGKLRKQLRSLHTCLCSIYTVGIDERHIPKPSKVGDAVQSLMSGDSFLKDILEHYPVGKDLYDKLTNISKSSEEDRIADALFAKVVTDMDSSVFLDSFTIKCRANPNDCTAFAKTLGTWFVNLSMAESKWSNGREEEVAKNLLISLSRIGNGVHNTIAHLLRIFRKGHYEWVRHAKTVEIIVQQRCMQQPQLAIADGPVVSTLALTDDTPTGAGVATSGTGSSTGVVSTGSTGTVSGSSGSTDTNTMAPLADTIAIASDTATADTVTVATAAAVTDLAVRVLTTAPNMNVLRNAKGNDQKAMHVVAPQLKLVCKQVSKFIGELNVSFFEHDPLFGQLTIVFGEQLVPLVDWATDFVHLLHEGYHAMMTACLMLADNPSQGFEQMLHDWNAALDSALSEEAQSTDSATALSEAT
jgi:hypothetical protein